MNRGRGSLDFVKKFTIFQIISPMYADRYDSSRRSSANNPAELPPCVGFFGLERRRLRCFAVFSEFSWSIVAVSSNG